MVCPDSQAPVAHRRCQLGSHGRRQLAFLDHDNVVAKTVVLGEFNRIFPRGPHCLFFLLCSRTGQNKLTDIFVFHEKKYFRTLRREVLPLSHSLPEKVHQEKKWVQSQGTKHRHFLPGHTTRDNDSTSAACVGWRGVVWGSGTRLGRRRGGGGGETEIKSCVGGAAADRSPTTFPSHRRPERSALLPLRPPPPNSQRPPPSPNSKTVVHTSCSPPLHLSRPKSHDGFLSLF